MTEALTFDDVVDDAAFVSHEHQLHLADVVERLGEHRWQADLDARTLDFVGQQTLTTTVHLLGSTAENPGTWLWGWANPSGYSDDVTALGRQAAEFGRQYHLPELVGAEQPLTPRIGARLTDAVKIITSHWTSCSFEAGPGSQAYFLIDAPSLELPAASVPRCMRTLGESLSTGMIHDHRRAVASYARLRGLPSTTTPEASVTRLQLPDGEVTLSFDDIGRIADMSFKAGG